MPLLLAKSRNGDTVLRDIAVAVMSLTLRYLPDAGPADLLMEWMHVKTVRLALTAVTALAAASIVAWAPAEAQQRGGTAHQAPAPKKIEKNFPLGKNWIAISLNGKRYGGADRPSFVLDSQFRARGFGGCNTFSAVAFPLRDMGIAVGPLALTRRTCDKGVQGAEQAYLAALRYAQKWDIVNGQLVMQGPSGELRFDRTF